ncbi:unnamed protein product [Bursaphelenchus okinawaensis]|uniref:RNA helicase n=1 Tax=Bursaphelenchus okinawaensis TaxID=465554 RepID=A0A811K9C1_9BILA|nr:unnamed protein product [Bursaphelenchus okinawaensis]CAG9095641.1 unnamed protein product [Bursaphelenchus okinawaensis]
MSNRFVRPSYDEEDQDLALEQRSGANEDFVFQNPSLALSISQTRKRLPIAKYERQILYLCERFRTVIIVGETGSGKSTQVPQFLADNGWAQNGQQIAITQPRRVAAVTLAARVATEMRCPLGDKVGYVLRFNQVMSENTQIKYMTDGILLREFQSDPLLTKYSIVIVDESHERTATTDLLLGLLKRVLNVRLDLKLVVMSATMDAEVFKDFFETNDSSDKSLDTAQIISVEGRMYPVSIFYSKVPCPDYVKAAVDAAIFIHKTEKHGDILIFLTGQDEVETALRMIIDASKSLKQYGNVRVFPLYSGLSQKQQLAAFDSAAYGTRKIIVSTNVAETSVTISGVCYVIDCGFMKLRVYNTDNGVETLQTVKTSKSSAKQRAGRAGRIHPGKCYRLYPEEEYQKLLPSQVPELQRTDLSQVILTLKSLGINNFLKFQFPSRPPSQLVIQALNSLFALGAIDEDGMLTKPLGHTMSTFPLPPMHVKVLVSAATYECSEEMAAVLAMMQIQNVFIPGDNRHMAEVTKRKFAVEEGDHLTNLNVYTNFVENGKSSKWCRDHYVNYKGLCSAHNICEQLKRYLRKFDIPLKSCKGLIGETARIRRCLLTGFFSQCARYDHTGQYVTLRDSIPFKVYKGSTVMYRKDYPKYVVFTDVLQNSIRDLSVIELEWLREIAGHYYDFGHDPKNNMEENYEADQMGNLN